MLKHGHLEREKSILTYSKPYSSPSLSNIQFFGGKTNKWPIKGASS